MRGPCLEEFMKHTKIREWLEHSSSMLILVGCNNESVHRAGHCWLSPVALHIVAKSMESSQADPCAFYVLGLRDGDLFPQVLLSIIIQLLRLNRQALQNESQYAELRAEIREYRGATIAGSESHEEPKYDLLQKVALRVLGMFDPTKTVLIILDRVDRCKVAPIDHRKKLLMSLVHVVENAKARVRVLAVVNKHDWTVEDYVDELGNKDPRSVVLHRIEQGVAA